MIQSPRVLLARAPEKEWMTVLASNAGTSCRHLLKMYLLECSSTRQASDEKRRLACPQVPRGKHGRHSNRVA